MAFESILSPQVCSRPPKPVVTQVANGQLGYIQSPMTQDLGETFPALVDWFRDAAPVGRLGVPQDLSPTVCHLLSDAGSFISGSDILITGKFHSLELRLSIAQVSLGGIHAGRLDHLRKK
jgi:hypothetical protein